MSLSPNADLLEEGLALHRRGAVAEAATRYAAVPRADPNNVDANYCLVAIHCQQGRFDDGAAHAGKARSRCAPRPFGRALSALGQHEQALASFDRAIAVA